MLLNNLASCCGETINIFRPFGIKNKFKGSRLLRRLLVKYKGHNVLKLFLDLPAIGFTYCHNGRSNRQKNIALARCICAQYDRVIQHAIPADPRQVILQFFVARRLQRKLYLILKGSKVFD